MKIKEIAKLCGVSATTVSKIINNKADDISQEVKERVLETVKKYNYTPYGLPSKQKGRHFTICLLSSNMYYSLLITDGLVKYLGDYDYSLMVFDSRGSLKTERQNLSKISKKNIDGLIWEPVNEDSFENIDLFNKIDVHKICVNTSIDNVETYAHDFEKMGYLATKTLVDYKHKKIACIIKENSARSMQVLEGFKQCLFDNGILFNDNMLIKEKNIDERYIVNNEYTSAVCSHFSLSQIIVKKLNNIGLNIPKDFSIVSLMNRTRDTQDISRVSIINIPDFQLGLFLGEIMIDKCERNLFNNKTFNVNISVDSNYSIGTPNYLAEKNIVVVGCINSDYIISLDSLPTYGKIKYANKYMEIPGGKGINQAIGISNLNKKISLISCVGNDANGYSAIKLLNDNNVDTSFVLMDSKIHSSKVFIVVNEKGESSTIANVKESEYVGCVDLSTVEKAFHNIGVCLLNPGLMPIETMNIAAKLTKKYGGTTIYKPFGVDSLDYDLLKNIDIVIINRQYALRLCKTTTVEQAANHLLEKGVRVVVVTCDVDGALLAYDNKMKTFANYPTKLVDTTAAGDCFASVFATKLLDNYDYESCVKAALAGCSYTVATLGSSNSIVDEKSLNSIISKHNIILTKKV